MKLLWLTNIPSPYRVDFFNELGKLCQLTVLFEKRTSDERDSSWKNYRFDSFEGIFLEGNSTAADAAFCPGVTKYLKKGHYDKIVVTNYSTYTGIWAIAFMKLRGIAYCVEGDGAFAGSGRGLKEKLKTWLLSKAELCFSTAAEHDQYYRAYGVKEDRIARYPFTSLKEADILREPISPEQKQVLRQKLGMQEKKILISVGRFIYGKGYDVLLDALAKTDKEIGCYIIGGTPTEEYIQQVEALGLQHVHFVGFKQKAGLAEFYRAADAFVLPTRGDIWGLVVNEAMANGLPVITTQRCIAGMELITDPALGCLVPVDDVQALADAITAVMEQTDEETGNRVLAAIRPYTIENMVKRHMEVWKA